jgi:aspartate/methionine/tyrosine aminotransferase
MNPIFADQPTSIFEHMSSLARSQRAVNLGQGFPDFGWPDDVVEEAANALRTKSNQYPPMRGLVETREAVAAHYSRHQGLDIDAEWVTVTSGATEALSAALMALVEPGDEVVLFQPLYDAYLPLVLRAGAVPRLVSLTPPGWRITEEALNEAITPRTRIVLLNNPHNPTARLFDEDELALVADACIRNDVTVIADEVWEHLVFDERRFVPLAAVPGMAERTVKIGSAGKIFSMTGWKVGWIVAPPPLANVISKAHQFITFSTPPNLQSAVAYGLGKEDSYFRTMRAQFAAARDDFRVGLESAGYGVLPVEGTYFMGVDLSASGIRLDDVSFCEQAVREFRIAAIPVSAFYAKDAVTSVLRLCFAKRRETLDAALSALSRARTALAG